MKWCEMLPGFFAFKTWSLLTTIKVKFVKKKYDLCVSLKWNTSHEVSSCTAQQTAGAFYFFHFFIQFGDF